MKTQVKLLLFSDDGGSIEYVVLTTEHTASNYASFERDGCTLDGVFDVTACSKACPIDVLPTEQELSR